jgi:hypothetical protein
MYLSAKSVIYAAVMCLAAFLPTALEARSQDEKPRVAIFEPEEEVPKGNKPQLTAMTKSVIWGAVE